MARKYPECNTECIARFRGIYALENIMIVDVRCFEKNKDIVSICSTEQGGICDQHPCVDHVKTVGFLLPI